MLNQIEFMAAVRKQEPRDVLRLSQGSGISLEEVRRLRDLLSSREGPRDARLSLMVARKAPAALRVAQVRWFAENEPGTFLGHHGWMATVTGDVAPNPLYEECKAVWLKKAESDRSEANVVDNAAWFMIQFEPETGAVLVDNMASRRTSMEWDWRALDYLHEALLLHPVRSALFASRALQVGFRMFRHAAAVEQCFVWLPVLIECAGLANRPTEHKSLSAAKRAVDAWRGADAAQQKQLVSVVRGLVAAAEGDLRGAEDAFLAASHVDTVPSEPLLSLAVSLVSLGLRDTVLAEAERWRRRHAHWADALANWIEAVRRGDEPDSIVSAV